MIKIAICDDDIDFMDKYDERIIDIFNKCTMGWIIIRKTVQIYFCLI